MMDTLLNASTFVITLVIVICVFFRKDHKWDLKRGRFAMRFFTAQSNVLCAAASLLLMIFPQSHGAWLLKYIGTVTVTVTILTVFLFLGPSIGKGWAQKLLTGPDFFLHLVNPILALITFCFFERRSMTFGQALTGLVPVLLYGFLYIYKVICAPEGKRWKDFYGFVRGGKTVIILSGLVVGTFLVCIGLMLLQNIA